MEWISIKTPPVEGKPYLVIEYGTEYYIAEFDGVQWYSTDLEHWGLNVTHYMELPEPPFTLNLKPV